MASDIGKKTEDTIEIQKLKSNIRGLQRANDRDFIDIGRMVYEKFKDGEISDLDYVAMCEAIEKRDRETRRLEEEIERYQKLKLRLYEDLSDGIIDKAVYRRYI